MIYTIGAYKGGTGKTTTAAAFSDYIARKTRKKTLVIDMNSQGSLSLITAAKGSGGTMADAIQGRTYKPEKIAERLYIIPAAPELAELRNVKDISEAIREASESFYNVVIDTPPEFREAIEGALLASDRVIIPLLADVFGVQGFLQIIAAVNEAKRKRPRLQFSGVFLNQYNGRGEAARTIREAVIKAAKAEGVPYLGEVRKGVAVEKAALTQTLLYDYEPKSNPAADFAKIFTQIIKA